MNDTIRERIIQAVLAKAAAVRLANGYATDCGLNVQRAIESLDPDDLSAIVVWPQGEESARRAGVNVNTMTVKLDGLALHGGDNSSVIAERILADLIEVMVGISWTLPFTSGSVAPAVGDTVTGAISGAFGYVTGVTVTSGDWPTGDAAGRFSLRRVKGVFQAENLDNGAALNVATTNGNLSGQSAVDTTTAGLADDIAYTTGGTDTYAKAGDTATGVPVSFTIKYNTLAGDPYNQP